MLVKCNLLVDTNNVDCLTAANTHSRHLGNFLLHSRPMYAIGYALWYVIYISNVE